MKFIVTVGISIQHIEFPNYREGRIVALRKAQLFVREIVDSVTRCCQAWLQERRIQTARGEELVKNVAQIYSKLAEYKPDM